MAVTKIPEKTKIILWGKAAGRCQYKGCNVPLFMDLLTKGSGNKAYIAHIVADSPKGPRGHPTRSKKLAKDISNLMLLCDSHHRKIDKEEVDLHPEAVLVEMKKNHEHRIELQTKATEEMQSHILLYGANIGVQSPLPNFEEASNAILPVRYPASTYPFELSMKNNVVQDDVEKFWSNEVENLRSLYQTQVQPLIANGKVSRLSVFGLAPQPLLIELGRLIGDINKADVHQLQREPTATWKWSSSDAHTDFKIQKPNTRGKKVALNISLSDHISEDRITKVLGDVPIWTLTIDKPDKDFMKSQSQLSEFRTRVRSLLGEIKTLHGQDAELHIFPAMPVSTAIELGRVWMQKADLPLHIYDQNYKTNGFVKAHVIKHT